MFKTTVGVDGMMCGMCEAHVNDAIREKFDIEKVKSSHMKGETVIISEAELEEAAVAEAIGATGYRVTGFASEPYEKKGFFGR